MPVSELLRLLHSTSTCGRRLLPSRHLQGLNLALACLSFDFVGTCLDESSEELCTIQVGLGHSGYLT